MSRRKVLLIGWDAADWKVIHPLLDGGEMPNLQGLIERGVIGNLATLRPVLSPMLWTSIATGKRAWKHGIHGFSEPNEQGNGVRPITNLGRKTKALWNILQQNGLRSNVIGWWPSNPVEPISGVMVSDQFQKPAGGLDQPWPMRRGTVHPPELTEILAELRVHPHELEGEQLLPFVPRAADIDQDKDKRLLSLAKVVAECASVHAAATGVMQNEEWDLMAVYYDAIDHFCHGFMRYHPPRLPWVSEEDFDLYKDVVNAGYRFHDMMLGTLLHLAGDDVTTIIVSDHGFHPDHLRPMELPNEPAGPAEEHRPFGVFVAAGPGIKQDERVYGASLLDVTPTILQLFGLPLGKDMDGKPLLGAMEDPVSPEYIDSWDEVQGDSGEHPADTRIDPVDNREALQQLVDLGYIDSPDENVQTAVDNTVRELRYNLARDLRDAHRYPQAIEVLDALYQRWPEEARFGVEQFHCHLARGETIGARALLNRIRNNKQAAAEAAQQELDALEKELEGKAPEDIDDDTARKRNKLRKRAGTNELTLAYLEASLLTAEHNYAEALAEYAKAEQIQIHNRPSLYQAQGECHLALRQWAEAAERFNKALAIDPINPNASLGLCRALLGQRQWQAALERGLESVSLVYHQPQAHYWVAVALLRLGRPEDARRALETAIAQNPVFPAAHKRLARLLAKAGDKLKASEHWALAIESRQRIANFQAGNELPDAREARADMAGAASLGALGEPKRLPPLAKDEIVIVSGLPRSGTSMMMQMLAAAGLPVLTDEQRVADESNPRGYFELEAVKTINAGDAWLRDAQGRAVKIVAPLLPRLPAGHKYRVIFMERPLAEVVASQRAMLERLDKAGAETTDAKLAKTFLQQVAQVKRLLARHSTEVNCLSVSYEQALTNPTQVAAQISGFLGMEANQRAMINAIAPELRNQDAGGA